MPLDLRGRPRAACQALASSRLAQSTTCTHQGVGAHASRCPGWGSATSGTRRYPQLDAAARGRLENPWDRSLWDLALLAAIASETFNVCLGVDFSFWFSSGPSL